MPALASLMRSVCEIHPIAITGGSSVPRSIQVSPKVAAMRRGTKKWFTLIAGL
jgi:hypothetical protein